MISSTHVLPDLEVAFFVAKCLCKGMTGDMAASSRDWEVTGDPVFVTPVLTLLSTPFWVKWPFAFLLALPFCFAWPRLADCRVPCDNSKSQSSSLSPILQILEDMWQRLLVRLSFCWDLNDPFLACTCGWPLFGVSEEPFCESIFLNLACRSNSGDCRGRFLPGTGVCSSDKVSGDNLWPSNSLRTKKAEGWCGLGEYSTWKGKCSISKKEIWQKTSLRLTEKKIKSNKSGFNKGVVSAGGFSPALYIYTDR